MDQDEKWKYNLSGVIGNSKWAILKNNLKVDILLVVNEIANVSVVYSCLKNNLKN